MTRFYTCHKTDKKFKSLFEFGERILKIIDVCMDFEPYFKVHNLVSVHPKSIILGQMTNLNMIFYVVVLVYRLVKIWNSPQFPDEFRNGHLGTARSHILRLDTRTMFSYFYKPSIPVAHEMNIQQHALGDLLLMLLWVLKSL